MARYYMVYPLRWCNLHGRPCNTWSSTPPYPPSGTQSSTNRGGLALPADGEGGGGEEERAEETSSYFHSSINQSSLLIHFIIILVMWDLCICMQCKFMSYMMYFLMMAFIYMRPLINNNNKNINTTTIKILIIIITIIIKDMLLPN